MKKEPNVRIPRRPTSARRTSPTINNSSSGGYSNKVGIIIAVLIISAAFWFMFGKEDSDTGSIEKPIDVSENVEKQLSKTAPLNKLNPNPFKPRIESLEEVLYKESPPDIGDGGFIGSITLDIAQQVRKNNPGWESTYSFAEILSYGSLTSREEDIGYGLINLPAARKRWEKLRKMHFTDAHWFNESYPELDELQFPKEPEASSEEIEELRYLADDIESLINDGLSEAMDFGEIYVDVPERGPETSELVSEWNDWVRSWTETVQSVGEGFPTRPSLNAEPDLLYAYQELEKAVHELNLLPHGGGDAAIPYKNERANRLNTSIYYVEQARQYLDKAEGDKE